MPTPERRPGEPAVRERAEGATASAGVGLRFAAAFRSARVGLCFVYFGLGGLLISALALPIVRLHARLRGLSQEAVSLQTQRLVHLACRSFLGCMSGVMRVGHFEWVGEAALSRGGPLLVVANHPSLIDTPLLAAKLPQVEFIVSPDWMRIGWMRRIASAAGYLHAERGADVIREAAARLRAGRSVVVYPEGSRTPPEGLRRFQRGAAHIALEAGCDILPVVIRVAPRALMQGERWTQYPATNPVWRVEVGEPIRTDGAGGGERGPLAARRLTGLLEGYFEKRWERGGS